MVKIRVGLLVCAAVFLWIMAFQEALHSAIIVWSNSNTYMHCFFVLPAALYFAWRERGQVLIKQPRPFYPAILPIIVLLLIWAMGYAGNIQFFQHVAAFAMIPLAVWLVLGSDVAKALWFPLGFVLFSIPVGEELVPWLQQITADIAVWMLNISSIPVYRDGLYITIPEGNFEVAEACSGVRFLIATLALGAIYAYVNYRSKWRQLGFLAIAIVWPILGNGLRVYGTILVARYWGMEYALGTDHLIYGWVFFGVIIFILFWFGQLWSEGEAHTDDETEIVINDAWRDKRFWKPMVLLLFSLILMIAWQSWMREAVVDVHRKINYQALSLNEKYLGQGVPWKPQFAQASDTLTGTLNGDIGAQLYIAYYATNRDGAELISSENHPFNISSWSLENRQTVTFFPKHSSKIEATLLAITSQSGSKRLVLYWYELPNTTVGSEIVAKLYQSIAVLFGRSSAGAIIALSVEYSSSYKLAESALTTQASDFYSDIRAILPIYDF